jgi:hypothetical protein
MKRMRSLALAALALTLGFVPAGSGRATIVAPGFTVTEIPLPDFAAGDVVVVGDALFVGVGAPFSGGAQSVIRIDSGGTTPIADGFNALAGFVYDAANDRLIVGDNALEAPGAVTGDTVFSIPDPLGSFPAPQSALGSELLTAGTLPGVADIVLDPGDPTGNTLFATDSDSFEVLTVDLLAGSTTAIQTTVGFAAGLAADVSTLFFGEVEFAAPAFIPDGTVSSVPLPGTGAAAPIAVDLPGQFDLELEAGGTLLSTSGGELLRIDPGTGTVTTLASGFGFATGLFEDGGTIWVLDGGFPGVDAVLRLVPIPVLVGVDIKPGSDSNAINLSRASIIPIAILTREGFDALTVDGSTVCFGANPPDPTESDCTESHSRDHIEDDVDGDGRLDLILHFDTAETGIAFGDAEACVTGKTVSGAAFEGCDVVETLRTRRGCGLGVELALLVPLLTWLDRGRRRRRRGSRCVALLLPAFLLQALLAPPAEAGRRRRPSPPPPIRFVTPTPGAEVTYMPLFIELDLTATGDLQTLEVLLNGSDITGDFTSSPPVGGRVAVIAQFVWDGLVLPGSNQLQVSFQVGSTQTKNALFDAVGDAYADAVDAYVVGEFGGFPGESFLPGIVIGPPKGAGLLQGGFDVFSLGFAGEMVVEFTNNVIVDGPGVDFTVFENAFMVENSATLTLERSFAEPAIVSVSQDGVVWNSFPCTLQLDIEMGIVYPGCAGVYPVLSDADDPATPHASIPTQGTVLDLIGLSSIPPPDPGGAGGDSYDLAEVGLAWARYVRIVDLDFPTGDPFGATNAGFDLDAVAAVRSVPATDADGNGVPDAVE